MKLLPGYISYTIDATFIPKKMFYCMYMPMQMSKYNEIKNEFKENNMPINWEIGMIEKSSLFGFGSIGLTHESGTWKIKDEFIAYKIIGEYNQMRAAYQKIKQDYPTAHHFYNLYLTDPNTTKMEENITYILFQVA